MEKVQSTATAGAPGAVSGQDESRLRNGSTVNGASGTQRLDSADAPGQFSSPLPDPAEAERQARAEEEARRYAALRVVGRPSRNGQSVEAFATFDRSSSRIQRAEFYTFNDPDFKRNGRF